MCSLLAHTPGPHTLSRTQMLERPWFYYYLLVSNFVLRLSWTHKLSPHLRNDKMAVVLIVMLEALRRATVPAVGGGALFALGATRPAPG